MSNATEWRHLNPERDQENRVRERAAFLSDPERIARKREVNRLNRQKNSARYRAIQKLWHQAHPEKARATCERYRKSKPWALLLAKARIRARKSGLDFALTHEWAIARWTGKCELTGLQFSTVDSRAGPYSASLDRVDSSKGYTSDNCRFILWGLNRFKGDGTDEEMRAIARALAVP